MYLSKKILLELMHDDTRSKFFGFNGRGASSHPAPRLEREPSAAPMLERFVTHSQSQVGLSAAAQAQAAGAAGRAGGHVAHVSFSHTHGHGDVSGTSGRDRSDRSGGGGGGGGGYSGMHARLTPLSHVHTHRASRVAHADPSILSRPNPSEGVTCVFLFI